jgi:hypothetical protein
MLSSGQRHSYLLASVGGRGTRVVRTAGEELQDITGRWVCVWGGGCSGGRAVVLRWRALLWRAGMLRRLGGIHLLLLDLRQAA